MVDIHGNRFLELNSNRENPYRKMGLFFRFIFIFFYLIIFSFPILQGQERKKTPDSAIIKIDGHELQVAVANTGETRRRGLMFVKKLNKNHGMIFIFPRSEKVVFWMKDTLIPLDIAYFDRYKKLREIRTMQPDNGRKIFPSKKKIRFVLETNAGWFAEKKIKIGSKITIPQNIRGYP